MTATGFNYGDFLLWGTGIGKVVTDLQSQLHVERVLLHSDLLSLALEIGIVPFVIFMYLFFSIKHKQGRLFALFLAILFSTDNVIIYQHVMFIYLFIQGDIRRRSRKAPAARGASDAAEISARAGLTGSVP